MWLKGAKGIFSEEITCCIACSQHLPCVERYAILQCHLSVWGEIQVNFELPGILEVEKNVIWLRAHFTCEVGVREQRAETLKPNNSRSTKVLNVVWYNVCLGAGYRSLG